MPYVVKESFESKRGRTTAYTITNSHDGFVVGMVTENWRGKWKFTATNGKTRIPRRTHTRQIRGMRKAVQEHQELIASFEIDKVVDGWHNAETRPDTIIPND
jgi:hypothetical protein